MIEEQINTRFISSNVNKKNNTSNNRDNNPK